MCIRDRDKRKSLDLVRSFLPKSAASEIKSLGKVTPRRYEDVAILICDLVGFTKLCEDNSPETVVEELETEEVIEVLEEVKETVYVEEKNKRFGIETQTQDILDELLAEYPSNKRTKEVLKLVQMQDFSNRKPNQLSG